MRRSGVSCAPLPERIIEWRRCFMPIGPWPRARFAIVWNRERHVCRSFAIPSSYDLWRGADDGLAAPASILWGAFDKIQGRIYVISELFQSGMCPRRWAAV